MASNGRKPILKSMNSGSLYLLEQKKIRPNSSSMQPFWTLFVQNPHLLLEHFLLLLAVSVTTLISYPSLGRNLDLVKEYSTLAWLYLKMLYTTWFWLFVVHGFIFDFEITGFACTNDTNPPSILSFHLPFQWTCQWLSMFHATQSILGHQVSAILIAMAIISSDLASRSARLLLIMNHLLEGIIISTYFYHLTLFLITIRDPDSIQDVFGVASAIHGWKASVLQEHWCCACGFRRGMKSMEISLTTGKPVPLLAFINWNLYCIPPTILINHNLGNIAQFSTWLMHPIKHQVLARQ